MTIRTFHANDGSNWTVWRTRADVSVLLPNAPREWLTFQSEEGTERRRLLQIPASWFELSDARLDLLRRVADPVTTFTARHSPPGGFDAVEADIGDA